MKLEKIKKFVHEIDELLEFAQQEGLSPIDALETIQQHNSQAYQIYTQYRRIIAHLDAAKEGDAGALEEFKDLVRERQKQHPDENIGETTYAVLSERPQLYERYDAHQRARARAAEARGILSNN